MEFYDIIRGLNHFQALDPIKVENMSSWYILHIFWRKKAGINFKLQQEKIVLQSNTTGIRTNVYNRFKNKLLRFANALMQLCIHIIAWWADPLALEFANFVLKLVDLLIIVPAFRFTQSVNKQFYFMIFCKKNSCQLLGNAQLNPSLLIRLFLVCDNNYWEKSNNMGELSYDIFDRYCIYR